MKNRAKRESGRYRGAMARGRNKEAEVHCEDKQRDQMALKEKLLMKTTLTKGEKTVYSALALPEKKTNEKKPCPLFSILDTFWKSETTPAKILFGNHECQPSSFQIVPCFKTISLIIKTHFLQFPWSALGPPLFCLLKAEICGVCHAFCPPRRKKKEVEADDERTRGSSHFPIISPLSLYCHPVGSVKCRPPG